MAIDQNQLVRALMKERAKLFAYIWAIVHDEHLAEDVLQDVSTLILEKSQEIESEVHLMGWMRRAARYRAFKAIEARKRVPLSLDRDVLEMMEAEWGTIDEASSTETIDALRCCLNKLSPYAGKLVRHRYVDGLTGEALAKKLQRKVATVYVALARVHKSLAGCIKQQLRKEAHDG